MKKIEKERWLKWLCTVGWLSGRDLLVTGRVRVVGDPSRRVGTTRLSREDEEMPRNRESLKEARFWTGLERAGPHARDRIALLGSVHLPGGCVTDTREKESLLPDYDPKVESRTGKFEFRGSRYMRAYIPHALLVL
ncbi:hypothetical protein CRG98_013262 [Punica granatum]|uniref:Uncharacterized protein n=1 Tax=Punica granatum TaxID=22663 RepID=A0A2I0KDH3_PUNGR|nr:hypothetical protein CRG98_013262 [Punica granatum]